MASPSPMVTRELSRLGDRHHPVAEVHDLGRIITGRHSFRVAGTTERDQAA